MCWRNFVRKLRILTYGVLCWFWIQRKHFFLVNFKSFVNQMSLQITLFRYFHARLKFQSITKPSFTAVCSFCHLFSPWGVGLFAKICDRRHLHSEYELTVSWILFGFETAIMFRHFREFYFEFSRAVITSLVFLFSCGGFFQKFQQSFIKVTCSLLVHFSCAVPRFALFPGQHDDLRLESSSLTANDDRQGHSGDHDCLRSAQDCVPHNHNWNVGN